MERKINMIVQEYQLIEEELAELSKNINEVSHNMSQYVNTINTKVVVIDEKDLDTFLDYELKFLSKISMINGIIRHFKSAKTQNNKFSKFPVFPHNNSYQSLELNDSYHTNNIENIQISSISLENESQPNISALHQPAEFSFELPEKHTVCYKPLTDTVDWVIDGLAEESMDRFKKQEHNSSTNLIDTMEMAFTCPSPLIPKQCAPISKPFNSTVVGGTESMHQSENILNNHHSKIGSHILSSKNMDLIEFSNSESETEGVKKGEFSAVEKLNQMQVANRNKETAMRAMQSLPDFTMLPVKKPKAVKNNLEIKDNKFTTTPRQFPKKDNENINYELQKKNLPSVGELCLFSYIESPSVFYIHLVDAQTTMIDQISNQIAKSYTECLGHKTKEEAYSRIGKFCVAYISSYKRWYRVQVLDWCLEMDCSDVQVQLVDFGNKFIVSFRSLRNMTKSIADLPILAVRCHLPYLYPPGSNITDLQKEWPQSSIDTLCDIGGVCKENESELSYFEIIYVGDTGDSVAIDLIHTENGNAVDSVGQVLINLGLAVEIINDYTDDNLAEFLGDVDAFDEPDNINDALLGYNARDELRICKHTRPDGTCFKGKHCKLEHTRMPKDGYSTDKICVFYAATNDLYLPREGEVVEVLITEFIETCRYWAQIIRVPDKVNGHFLDRNFYKLLKTMNNKKTISTYKPMKVSPALGEVIIVRHWTNKWLRGVVRDLLYDRHGDLKEVQVCMVDYGDTWKVPLKDIRQMNEVYMQLPFQRTEIYLKHYEETSNCDKVEAKQYFNSHIYFKNFSACIMSSNEPYAVKLTTLHQGNDIGVALQRNGFAEMRKCDLNVCNGVLLLE